MIVHAAKMPRLYAILDPRCFPDTDSLLNAAAELATAGVTLIQYRDKLSDAKTILSTAQALRSRLSRTKLSVPRRQLPFRLIMNDRADLCIAAEFDGVHIGQDDLSADSARRIIGQGRWLGVSTHDPQQVIEAEKTSADYVAIGPVFPTGSKLNPDPVVGLEGVRAARALTRKPLVAIGGITRQNCCSVIEAGADSVAVISDLLPDPAKSAEEFLRILG